MEFGYVVGLPLQTVYAFDYILGNPSVDFKTEQGDINKDGVITITDAVGIVDIILKQ